MTPESDTKSAYEIGDSNKHVILDRTQSMARWEFQSGETERKFSQTSRNKESIPFAKLSDSQLDDFPSYIGITQEQISKSQEK